MVLAEPVQTALLLTIVGLLLAASVVSSRASRYGIPIVLVFLAIGMLAGSEGLGGIEFEDYHLAFRIGTIALVLILFDGGLNTPRGLVREVGAPAAVLATLGVVATAGLVGVVAYGLGFPWREALLLGAIVSSTDAAAVFSVIRSGEMELRRRVAATLEVESGLNDPMAVVLTLALTELALVGHRPGIALAGHVVLQLVLGGALGWVVGRLGGWMLARLRPAAGGLYAVLTLALAFVAFGVTTLLSGSGFLAVYVAGVVLGNRPMPYRSSVLRVHDALGWLSQAVMFLVLGLLVFPSRVQAVAWPGIPIAVLLAVVIRPLVTVLCLLPFSYSMRERLYIGWMGLRGAVPIILGTFPVLAGVVAGELIFNIVFFVVLASVLLQGGTARWVTRRLGLGRPVTPAPLALLELNSRIPLRSEILSFFVLPEVAVAGTPLSEIPFPAGAGAVLVIRGDQILAPREDVVLQPGDHVYVFGRAEDRPFLHLLFGRSEGE